MPQSVAWLILAAIHLLPAMAFFRPVGLATFYGVRADSPLFILMRHRAGLFLAIFLACLWAVFDQDGRKLASVVVAASMLTFLLLYWLHDFPSSFRKIALVDLGGLPVLAFVACDAFAS